MKQSLDFFRNGAWEPFRELANFQRGLSRLFEGESDHWIPDCDIEENENRYLVSVEVPGVPKENVKVEFQDGALVVSGEKSVARKEDQSTRHLEERTHGSFRRWFMLPGEVDAGKIQATYESGVLRIIAPKLAASKPKQIPISEGASEAGSASATRVA